MRTIGSYEAKTHLPRLLDEVAASREPITITKNGKPVAQLIPAEDLEERRRKADEAWETWTRIRDEQNITLGPDLTLQELVAEGRRHPIDDWAEQLFDRMDERDGLNKQNG
ncbi:MAG TPA: type II toxin-antitoxin system Phd/YefM family antitoxin [Chloroflexota bacterium]|jgi:prevent-host-death family protein